MLALDLLQPVAHGLEEVLVGGDDGAVEIELDHRLRFVDRLDLSFVIGCLHLRRA